MEGILCGLAIGVFLLMSGCRSYEDFRKPLLRNYAADAATTRPSQSDQPSTRTEEMARVLAEWQKASPGQQQPYRIGPGDTMRVSLLAAGQARVTNTAEVVVGDDGDIGLPLIGKVQVEGQTTAQVERKVADLYAQGYYRTPTVTVTVSRYDSKEIMITGAVRNPGALLLRSNRVSVLEALVRAGGVDREAGAVVQVTRAGNGEGEAERTATVDLEQLLSGDLSQNVWACPGDVIAVRSAPTEYFYVLGYVRSPGAYPLPGHGTEVSLMDAVAFAGGLKAAARASRASLIRRTPDGEKSYHVDLTRVAGAREPDITIQPDDTVIIGTSWGRRTLDGFLHVLGLGRFLPTY